MSPENLTELVSRLSPEEQAAVREFIEFMKRRKKESELFPFLARYRRIHGGALRVAAVVLLPGEVFQTDAAAVEMGRDALGKQVTDALGATMGMACRFYRLALACSSQQARHLSPPFFTQTLQLPRENTM